MTEHEIEVERRVPDENRRAGEWVALVDGHVVVTATQLLDRGFRGPHGPNDWQTILRSHALSYCDGLDAEDQ